jgi:hypothetical protein
MEAKQSLSNATLYPAVKHRYVGVEGRRNMRLFAQNCGNTAMGMDTYDDGGSTYEAERLYSRTGWHLSGDIEANMAWLYAHLKPRLFYRIGLSQFRVAKYIQQIFNVIIDKFPNVHTFLRHHTSSLASVGPGDFIAFIYDYSAFTSSLEELRHFVSALANFLRGTTVTVIDSFHGPVQQDLGDLLDDYNSSSNFEQDFDATDIYQAMELLLRHTTGMLGVPGNISSCTLLHGIHLTIVLGSILANKVVGDDAVGFIKIRDNPMTTYTLQDRIDNMGSVSLMKGAMWHDNPDEEDFDDVTWNYVKRPIYRLGNHMFYGEMVTWPSPIYVYGTNDGIHTCDVDLLDNVSRQRTFCKQLCRFYEALEWQRVQEFELGVIRDFNRISFSMLKLSWRSQTFGELGFLNPGVTYHPGWKEAYVEEHYWSIGSVADSESPCAIEEGFHIVDGPEFISTSYPILRWCVQMGYMEKSNRFKQVIVGEYDNYAATMYPGKDVRFRYDYRVIAEIPKWAIDMIKDLPIFVHDEQCVSICNDDDYDMDWMYRDTDSDSDYFSD